MGGHAHFRVQPGRTGERVGVDVQIDSQPAARMEGSECLEQQRFPETPAPVRAADAQDRDVATRAILARILLRADIPGELISVPGNEPEPGVVLWRIQVVVAEVLIRFPALSPVVGERLHMGFVELPRLLGSEAANTGALDVRGGAGSPAKSMRRSSKRRTSQ
jgi:hypothetical protein